MTHTRIRSMLFATAAAIAVSACGADDVASPGEGVIVLPAPAPAPAPAPTPTPTPPTGGPAASCPNGTANVGVLTLANGGSARNCQISGVIQGSLTIPNNAGTVYSLSGAVQVGQDAGATGAGASRSVLTIEPGVVLFGSSGGDFLLVNRGSQIFAEGTASRPIVFTSRQNMTTTNNVDSIGQWGGIVILGRAPISNCTTGDVSNPGGTRTDCEAIVEGPTNAVYGGNAPADSSGRISYVQVRYPGFEVSPGNELNGITLAGVGSGTFFQNVQVHNSSDDGIEWFGGRVNTKNVALTGNDDDSIDSDLGYKGFNQYYLVVQRANGGDHGWEADSNGDEDAQPRQYYRLSNATIVSRRMSAALLLRGGGDYALYNSVVTGPQNCIDIDSQTTIQTTGPDEAGPPIFQSVFLSCATAFENDGNVTVAQASSIFSAGTNNVANGVSTLMMMFINGANETAVTPFAVSGVSSFFENTSYIGAVKDANDARFKGWTCGLYAEDRACTDVPAITAN